MLPHCLETGVKVTKKQGRTEQRRSSISITNGVCISEDVSSCETTYTIQNKKDEEFKMLVEHEHVFAGSQLNFKLHQFAGKNLEIEENEKISNGARVYFVLKPNQKVVLRAMESMVHSQTIHLDNRTDWLFKNYVHVDSPIKEFMENEGVQACIKLNDELDEVQTELDKENTRCQSLERQADRVRQNIEACQQSVPQEWIDDLGKTERSIRKITEELVPKLTDQQQDLQHKLRNALKEVTAKWTA